MFEYPSISSDKVGTLPVDEQGGCRDKGGRRYARGMCTDCSIQVYSLTQCFVSFEGVEPPPCLGLPSLRGFVVFDYHPLQYRHTSQ